MEFVPKAINEYAENHSQAESVLLAELNRETHLKIMIPRMLSGHLQGRALSMFSKMIKPEKILEIGTYTGYSALCLAEGLKENGTLITIDINEELKPIIDKYWQKSKFNHQLSLKVGDATEIIPNLKHNFDLVFIDADKENYSTYYDLIISKLNIGGYIIADNVLWSGNVLKDKKDMQYSTKCIADFNQKVHLDDRVENVLLPIRDGLMVLRKLY